MMQEDLFGTLTVRLMFTKRIDDKRHYSGQASLVRFHGTLDETRKAYVEWLGWNTQLADQVQATFEVRIAVHPDD